MFRVLLCLAGLAAVSAVQKSDEMTKIFKNALDEEEKEKKDADAEYEEAACLNRDNIKETALDMIRYKQNEDAAKADEEAQSGKRLAAEAERDTAADAYNTAEGAYKTAVENIQKQQQENAAIEEDSQKLLAAYVDVMAAISNRRPSLVQMNSAKTFLRNVLLQGVHVPHLEQVNQVLLALEEKPGTMAKRTDAISSVVKAIKDARSALKTQIKERRESHREKMKGFDATRLEELNKMDEQSQLRDAAEERRFKYEARELKAAASKTTNQESYDAAAKAHKTFLNNGIAEKTRYDDNTEARNKRIALLKAAEAAMGNTGETEKLDFVQIKSVPVPRVSEIQIARPHGRIQRALSMLAKKALQTKDATLTALVVASSKKTGNAAFKQVVQTISKMMTNIQKQIADISSANSQCSADLKKANDELEDQQTSVQENAMNLQQQSNEADKQEAEENEQEAIRKHKEESKKREEEHFDKVSAHMNSVINRVTANMESVKKEFVEKLTESEDSITVEYDDNDHMVHHVPDSHKAVFNAVKGYYDQQVNHQSKTKEALETLKGDWTTLEGQLNTAISNAETAKEKASTAKSEALEEKANYQAELRRAEDALDAAHSILDNLNKQCVQGEGIAERVEARKGQIEQLKAALAVLRG